ncbi:uncharacterized protein PITG_13589 [Phytophthora infestans T30-4]|uniref:DDE Tnp4 domain-containing protein n=1 Tax=Phytophthora infestans (strain T30-4) TaxID=403677 RepID=D0NMC3_PHYIT|nr:uncharacterized protein PITG_13589 [Phytophthora infestans T30-4]EEY60844.1 conserved hypothetical protein [Phytophthora infestans T30-4]|eukprot:XP_002899790.1 conserved hypothetical protein [Phytophthora infestans T30-4]
MLQSAAYASWFEDNMRCTKETFLRLGRFLQEHGIRFANAKVRQHSYEKKVAAALYFLGSSGGYREVGAAMGMSRSYVKEITDEVIHVLKLVACQVISFPRDRRRWNTIEDQFALRQGYPGVVGAIDGSLVEVERPDDFDGFYCRKSYPALNVQAIVTMDNYFLSVEVRPGSWSDRKCWQHSVIARNVFNIIPAGTHFVGDAGYALSPGLMVPYSDREEGGALTERQNKFNYFHSSTRMVVESTFGHWKGRFKILQCTLNQDTPRDASDVIVATIVLHNLIISFRDAAAIPRYVEEDDDELVFDDTTCSSRQRDVAVAKRNAIANLLWP